MDAETLLEVNDETTRELTPTRWQLSGVRAPRTGSLVSPCQKRSQTADLQSREDARRTEVSKGLTKVLRHDDRYDTWFTQG